MAATLFTFCSNILIPVIMVIAGLWMYKKPPKKINGLAGYRTSLSMKNMDTWKFAHEYCGKLWLKVGAVLLVVSVLIQLPFIKGLQDRVGLNLLLMTAQIIVLIASIFPTEKALKRTFDKNGNRIEEQK